MGRRPDGVEFDGRPQSAGLFHVQKTLRDGPAADEAKHVSLNEKSCVQRQRERAEAKVTKGDAYFDEVLSIAMDYLATKGPS